MPTFSVSKDRVRDVACDDGFDIHVVKEDVC